MMINKRQISCDIAILIIFLCSTVPSSVTSNGIKSKIYSPIESQFFCFRRFNATNQIGCQSDEGGNVGVIHLVENETDIIYIINQESSNVYIPVVTPDYFTTDFLLQFRKSKKVSGVILIIDDSLSSPPKKGYSPDSSCPNQNFGLYVDSLHEKYGHCSSVAWNGDEQANPLASAMYHDWPFPIFMIQNKTDIDLIKKCFVDFNLPHISSSSNVPLCAIEMVAPMSGAKDTPTCMRRNEYFVLSQSPSHYCDPLGGHNIFGTLFATSNSTQVDNRSIIIVSSRLDSFSLFDQLSPGADSSVTSIVTLLSIARTLSDLREQISRERGESKHGNVLFSLFDGEAFDYIGSSRAVYDMEKGRPFPDSSYPQADLNLKHFSHFIELNQLAVHSEDVLYMHKNVKATDEESKLMDLIIKTASSAGGLKIKKVSADQPLPPSSLQSFLKSDTGIAGIVIANHEKEFANKYYNSIYDTYDNINRTDSKVAEHLASISKVVSGSIYEMLVGHKSDKEIVPDVELIQDLLECYLLNTTCYLFQVVSKPNARLSKINQPAYPSYVGVSREGSYEYRTFYTNNLMMFLTGEQTEDATSDACRDHNNGTNLRYVWMAGRNLTGVCIKSQVSMTQALSPAFIDDVDWRSSKYSTWTESSWRESSARIFIRPSSSQEWFTFMTGIIIIGLSFFFIHYVNKRSNIIFTSEDVRDSQTYL